MLSNFNIIYLLLTAWMMTSGFPAHAKEYVWDGGAADSKWDSPQNWTADSDYPGAEDTAVFPDPATSPAEVNLNGTQNVAHILFTKLGRNKNYKLSDGTIVLSNGGTITYDDSPDLKFRESSIPEIAATITLAGDATIANHNKWYLGEERILISGQISGSGTITIEGESAGVELNADNSSSFTGTIVINSGSVTVRHAGSLGDTATGTTLNGGHLRVSGHNYAEPFTIAGDSYFCSWTASKSSGNIEVLKGVTFTISGRNTVPYSGVISGPGNLSITGGNITLEGEEANTLTGKTIIAGNADGLAPNRVKLNKPAGTAAIAGDIEMLNRGSLQWLADNQVADTSSIRIGPGKKGSTSLEISGCKETLGPLDLDGDLSLYYGDGGVIHFAESIKQEWTAGKEMIIEDWRGSDKGQLFFGQSSSGLSANQLAQIGFRNPAGKKKGLYTARILKSGEVVPATICTPSETPFDISESAQAKRSAIYTTDGRNLLTGAKTPLKKGTVIDFFGDSITWQNVYPKKIREALAASEFTKGFGITCHTRGINGGTSLHIRDGKEGVQEPFASVIAKDKPDVVVLFIGINDIWWAKTSEQDYEKALLDIIAQSKHAGVKHFVMATPMLNGEHPNGGNKDDAKIELFTKICKKVATDTGVTYAPLRKYAIAYLQNNNYVLKLDGSVSFKERGLLTGDKVHPSIKGTDMLADWLSKGIYDAMTSN